MLRTISNIEGREVECIIDTSRNSVPPSHQKEWCNFYNALTVIGRLPTKEIDYIDIYAYAWLKILEESDKECSGRTHD